MPKLDEVKAKVRDDVLKQKAIDAARQKAAAVDAQMKSGDFDAAAKAPALEVKTTDLIARGAPIADVGVSPAIDAAAFALPAGGVSDPIVTDNGSRDRQGARDKQMPAVDRRWPHRPTR